MKDLSYAIETLQRKEALRYHLTGNFYPPLPEFVKDAFVDVFEEYWNGELMASELDDALAERAYYTGGIWKYDFYQFLDEADLEAYNDI